MPSQPITEFQYEKLILVHCYLKGWWEFYLRFHLRYRKIYNKVPPKIIMKIIKVLSKKVGDIEYKKYLLNLPKDVVEESKLLGKNLIAISDKEKIIIKKEDIEN